MSGRGTTRDVREALEELGMEYPRSDREPSAEEVLELAEKHIPRYRRQLERAMAGMRGYRADENKELLDLWVSIKAKGGHWAALSVPEMQEIQEALASGE